MKIAILSILCLIMCIAPVWAQDIDTSQDTQDMISVPRSEFEELKASVEEMRRELDQLKADRTTPTQTQESVLPSTETAGGEDSEPAPASGGGRQLALPEISLIVQTKGKLSSDKRDEERNHLRVSEAELAIQGYVYPNVKADAFLAASPEEDEPMQVEEAYLTYLSAFKGLNAYIGKKHVPFGRTNLLHPHSWPYARQPLVITNLVAEESLAGEGLQASYLIPTNSNLFAQIDLGTWTGEGSGETSDLPDIVAGPGASFSDKFNTARLWLGYPVTEDSEIELGGSYAHGNADGLAINGKGNATLTGIDVSYRRYWEGNRRLLLRGETVRREEKADVGSSAADGYYLFAEYRPDKYNGIGLLYDWSEFPQLTGSHESAISLVLTRQFSEQYYMRLQGTHGSRPGDNSYDELLLQWVWGIGPHTHNLE